MKVNTRELQLAMIGKQVNVAKVAREIGMTPQGIHTILRTGNSTYKTIGKLSEYLGVDPEKLIQGE